MWIIPYGGPLLRRVFKVMLARWRSQPNKYLVRQRQSITERLQIISSCGLLNSCLKSGQISVQENPSPGIPTSTKICVLCLVSRKELILHLKENASLSVQICDLWSNQLNNLVFTFENKYSVVDQKWNSFKNS